MPRATSIASAAEVAKLVKRLVDRGIEKIRIRKE